MNFARKERPGEGHEKREEDHGDLMGDSDDLEKNDSDSSGNL